MILRSTDQKDALDERELRAWLIKELGDDDERTLSEWVWENKPESKEFVDALAAIVKQTGEHGLQFAHNLLEVAKKPKHVREAETEILAFVKPLLERLMVHVQGERGGEKAIAEARDEFLYRVEEKLYNMWPEKHRATMKGAMIGAFSIVGGAFSFNVGLLVRTLQIEDPLKATARSSR